jgi:hypothetical protein
MLTFIPWTKLREIQITLKQDALFYVMLLWLPLDFLLSVKGHCKLLWLYTFRDLKMWLTKLFLPHLAPESVTVIGNTSINMLLMQKVLCAGMRQTCVLAWLSRKWHD